MLERLVALARRRFGVDCQLYPTAVARRLELGAERFGDDAFLDRDNVTEALEECWDLGAYVVMELQRLASPPAEVRDDLLRVALLAAVADHYLRRARRRLREEARS